jgi:hypothetical protein
MNLDDYNRFCQALPHTAHVVQWGGAHVWKVAGITVTGITGITVTVHLIPIAAALLHLLV